MVHQHINPLDEMLAHRRLASQSRLVLILLGGEKQVKRLA
jgi:hypothetical protein